MFNMFENINKNMTKLNVLWKYLVEVPITYISLDTSCTSHTIKNIKFSFKSS